MMTEDHITLLIGVPVVIAVFVVAFLYVYLKKDASKADMEAGSRANTGAFPKVEEMSLEMRTIVTVRMALDQQNLRLLRHLISLPSIPDDYFFEMCDDVMARYNFQNYPIIVTLAANALAVGRLDLYSKLVVAMRGKRYNLQYNQAQISIEASLLLDISEIPHFSELAARSYEFDKLIDTVKAQGLPFRVEQLYYRTLCLPLIKVFEYKFPGVPQSFSCHSLARIHGQYQLTVEDIQPALMYYKSKGIDITPTAVDVTKFPEVVALIAEASCEVSEHDLMVKTVNNALVAPDLFMLGLLVGQADIPDYIFLDVCKSVMSQYQLGKKPPVILPMLGNALAVGRVDLFKDLLKETEGKDYKMEYDRINLSIESMVLMQIAYIPHFTKAASETREFNDLVNVAIQKGLPYPAEQLYSATLNLHFIRILELKLPDVKQAVTCAGLNSVKNMYHLEVNDIRDGVKYYQAKGINVMPSAIDAQKYPEIAAMLVEASK